MMIPKWPSFAVALVSATSVFAQPAATFDVVSIRPYVSHSGDARSEDSETKVSPGGRMTGKNVTVRKLIRNAFGTEDSRILDAPGWVDSESYNFEAKTTGGVEINRDNIQQLMESLLATRFHFQYHRENREMTEYALEVAKDGLKIKPHTGDTKPSMSTNSNSGIVTLKATAMSLKDFAGGIARQTGRAVVDRTGLNGLFDFELMWASDQAADAGPSIFTALQSLGLRLSSMKGPVEFIVVDHIEKASEN